MSKPNKTSIDKALDILKLLSQEPYKYTAIEISKQLHINRSTVHRILKNLADHKAVIQDLMDGKYKLGPFMYTVGSAYLVQKNFTNDVVAILNKIAEETRESVGYYVKDGDRIISVYEVESYQPIRLGYKPGREYPFYCGAAGKCITAFMEPEKLKHLVYNSKMEKRTPKTITAPAALLEEYAKIRKQGYAVSDEENLLGAYGVAAPVFNSNGEVESCVAAAALKTGLTQDKKEKMKKHVIKGAEEISERLI